MRPKSTVEQIRARFDADVERFSRLETGQSATMDAPLALELVAQAAARICPSARGLLDIGCGAGNFSLKILQLLPTMDVTLVDLSRPMLDRAVERIQPNTTGKVRAHQADIREVQLEPEEFDLIIAAAVLHHLREENEWRNVFGKLHQSLRPGGSLWISDLIQHSIPQVQAMMWERYGEYLAQLKGPEYREQVFDYVEQEDTPRPLLFQLELLKEVGFSETEVLHKNGCFAVFGSIK